MKNFSLQESVAAENVKPAEADQQAASKLSKVDLRLMLGPLKLNYFSHLDLYFRRLLRKTV